MVTTQNLSRMAGDSWNIMVERFNIVVLDSECMLMSVKFFCWFQIINIEENKHKCGVYDVFNYAGVSTRSIIILYFF